MTASTRRLIHVAWISLAWLVLGSGTSAWAAAPTRGDFDADGVLDTAIVRPAGTGSQIEVHLSGSALPVYLSPATPIVSLRSADVTGDGLADLIADGPERLHVWVSTGRTLVPAAHVAALSVVRTRAIHAPLRAAASDDDPCWEPRAFAITPSVPALEDSPTPHQSGRVHPAAILPAPGTLTSPRGPPLA